MSSVKTLHTHTAATSEEVVVSFGGPGMMHDLIIPAGTRCVKLEGGGSTPVWVVDDLSFIHDKSSMLYQDAENHRIKVGENHLANIAAVGQTLQDPALRVVPAPEDMVRFAGEMPETALREQYKDLIFTLQDAWGPIHGSRNDDLRTRAQAILHECGDFADTPLVISTDLNVRIYRVLVDSKNLILGRASFASQALREKLSGVLDMHSSLSMEREMPEHQVAENLREYLQKPELVDGWITPDAVALKDGSVKYTKYFTTPNGGLILRSALESDQPESPEGLVRRFEAGERFIPNAVKMPDILQVATAMDKVSWARRSTSTERAWWNNPDINDIVNDGVRAGYLHRPSTTQVEWSQSGRNALRAAYAEIDRNRAPVAGERAEGKLPDGGLSRDEADAISRLKASGRVAVRLSTSPGFGAGFDAYRLRENGSEGEILGSSSTEAKAWLAAAIRLAEFKPGELQMTSREFGSVWTPNVVCKDGSLGMLERRTRLEIRKLQGEYAVFSINRRYLPGEDPCDVRQRQEDGRFVTLGQAADYVGRYIGDYAEAAADNRVSAIEAQAESDAESASPSL
ncbi:MAG: hypothetical protein VB131_01385 [Burkholderia gladioli]